MSIEATLRALAAGETLPRGTLLQTVRMAAQGVEVYGEEDVQAAMARVPLAGELRFLGCDRHAALIGPGGAIFADCYGPHVARLWAIGAGQPATGEPAIAVPVDADCSQRIGAAAVIAGDHPWLAAHDLARIEAGADALAARWRPGPGSAGALRARPLCLRAFSAGEEAVGLFVTDVLSQGPVRQAGQVYGLVVCGAPPLTIEDAAGRAALARRAWRPRV